MRCPLLAGTILELWQSGRSSQPLVHRLQQCPRFYPFYPTIVSYGHNNA